MYGSYETEFRKWLRERNINHSNLKSNKLNEYRWPFGDLKMKDAVSESIAAFKEIKNVQSFVTLKAEAFR